MDLIVVSILAILAGAATSAQAGINLQLQTHWAQSPILAAFISFLVGAAGLLLLVLVTRTPFPAFPAKIVPWHWTGGFLGAFLVTVTVIAAPRLGATAMMGLILAGQIGLGVILDHYGLLGYAQRDITWQRIVGVALLAAGVFLIRKF